MAKFAVSDLIDLAPTPLAQSAMGAEAMGGTPSEKAMQ